MDYLPEHAQFAANLADPSMAYISRYALGRDYHKLIRNRLKQLGERIEKELGALGFRPFVDSAPILERPLAVKAGLGWQGKHSLVLNQDAGSWFFLGELLVDIPLPVDAVHTGDCGSCVACITICPTQAIVAPYTVDARRCISYLTIELQGAIPEEFRTLLGNRIYGCDDCQLVCPWNRFAKVSAEPAFHARHGLDALSLIDAFSWSEDEFVKKTEGSAISRIGYVRWLRNVAVALGNATPSEDILNALRSREQHDSEIVKTHVAWALNKNLRRK
jgi:epoxyqueuosine reductase